MCLLNVEFCSLNVEFLLLNVEFLLLNVEFLFLNVEFLFVILKFMTGTVEYCHKRLAMFKPNFNIKSFTSTQRALAIKIFVISCERA